MFAIPEIQADAAYALVTSEKFATFLILGLAFTTIIWSVRLIWKSSKDKDYRNALASKIDGRHVWMAAWTLYAIAGFSGWRESRSGRYVTFEDSVVWSALHWDVLAICAFLAFLGLWAWFAYFWGFRLLTKTWTRKEKSPR